MASTSASAPARRGCRRPGRSSSPPAGPRRGTSEKARRRRRSHLRTGGDSSARPVLSFTGADAVPVPHATTSKSAPRAPHQCPSLVVDWNLLAALDARGVIAALHRAVPCGRASCRTSDRARTSSDLRARRAPWRRTRTRPSATKRTRGASSDRVRAPRRLVSESGGRSSGSSTFGPSSAFSAGFMPGNGPCDGGRPMTARTCATSRWSPRRRARRRARGPLMFS